MERDHVRGLIHKKIQKHSFREYFLACYDLSVEQLESHSSARQQQRLNLIAMRVHRVPDGMYLASASCKD